MTRAFLDFKAVRERASFLGVLDRYHVPIKKVSASQYKADCPLPSHTNKDEHGTFGVNTDKGVFKCFSDSCRKAGNGSQGNVLDFVAAMEGVQAYDAAAKLNEWFPDGIQTAKFVSNGDGDVNKPHGNQNAPHEAERNGGGSEPSRTRNPHDSVPLDGKTPAPDVNRPLAFQLKDVNPEHPMIQSRGISVETAKRFGVGFFPGKGSMAGRIVFPLVEAGAVIGYAGRATLDGQEPKWLMPKGLVKSFLYGLEKCDALKPVVIVESCWAVLYLHQHGCQAAALLGSELTAAQEACLAPFTVITVAMDNDARGKEAADKIADRLKRNHKVLRARLME